jgi:hypothetical protein
MYQSDFYVNLNTKRKKQNILIKYRIDFTLSDVKCERSSICRIELSLASNDCNE